MGNAQRLLSNYDVCRHLNIGYFTRTGHMQNCSCTKYYKDISSAAAQIYCCLYGLTGNCWVDISK